MPFNTTSALLLHSARQYLPAAATAVEVLHQSLEVTDEVLLWIRESGAAAGCVDPAIISELLAMGWAARHAHTPGFYRALGFTSYKVLDADPKLADVVADFNLDLRRDCGYNDNFDFVCNNGSAEHIFDQRAAFKNIHNLCRTNGIMMHKLPTLDVLNIALYGYSPVFLHDLAIANNYEILDLRLSNRWGDTVKVRLSPTDAPPSADFTPTLPPAREAAWEACIGNEVADAPDLPAFLELSDLIGKIHLKNHDHPLSRVYHLLQLRGDRFRPNDPGEIFTLALYRKTSDAPFRVPFQSKFLPEIDSDDLRLRYRAQCEHPGLRSEI